MLQAAFLTTPKIYDKVKTFQMHSTLYISKVHMLFSKIGI